MEEESESATMYLVLSLVELSVMGLVELEVTAHSCLMTINNIINPTIPTVPINQDTISNNHSPLFELSPELVLDLQAYQSLSL